MFYFIYFSQILLPVPIKPRRLLLKPISVNFGVWWKILQWLVAVQNLKWKEFSVVGEDQSTSQLVESKKCWKQMQQPFQKLISRSSLFVNLCENWIREIAPNLSTKSWDGYLIVKLEVLSWSIFLSVYARILRLRLLWTSGTKPRAI